ncbi:AraC family transcriptional regulator [Bradyrhizobium sp. Gha]|uniref:helix-turn-helix transcriptional regulator n=1 Tax=Bradyrhizobium sp. Gha TaxID=1855318 RepID=UPI0008E6D2CB|nr:AraC family transcriptional regulator [Bradyrhizobium sp. Gha]SFH65412.1 AraC family transcriptional regulator [Bradyrhizobium sp. Gha]
MGYVSNSNEQRSGSGPSFAVSSSRSEGEAHSLGSARVVGFHQTVRIMPSEPVKRLGTGWHWWFSENIHVPVSKRIEFHFQGARHLLALYNEGARKDGETSIDGVYASKLRGFEHRLTFVPAGHAFREWHETVSSTRVTFLYVDPAAFQRPDDAEVSFLPRVYFEDSLVWETASKLKNAIEGGETNRVPYLEALSSVLAHELSQRNQDLFRESAPINRGGLASWQRRIVIEYIEEHLGEQVCLLKLAELARLSLHHFCRAFKQSFGVPAYQYQVQRRMELAKLLLADHAISITDIALSLGYAQTSSFSSAFRKTTGWTPTTFRREFK